MLTLEEYESVRSASNRFVLEPGHPTGDSTVVAETERFVVVEKSGLARQLAEETDLRRGGAPRGAPRRPA